MKYILIICFVVVEILVCNSERILIATVAPFYSHQIFVRPIIYELLNRGHEVISITALPINDPNLKNLTEIDISLKSVPVLFGRSQEKTDVVEGSQMYIIRNALNLGSNILDFLFNNSEVQSLIRNDENIKIDAMILEWVFVPLGALSIVYDCPLIGILPMGSDFLSNQLFATNLSPFYTYDINFPYSHPLSFWDLLQYMLHLNDAFDIYKRVDEFAQNAINNYFPNNSVTLKDIHRKVNVYMRNNHVAFSGPHVEVPGVVEIGGITKIPSKPLPLDLQLFLDNAVEGAIFVSFGSYIKSESIHEDKLAVLIETFKKLPYKILWKWDDYSLSKYLNNVLIANWFPQNDVLRHPNIKCFITHGGLQSVEQAIYAKVPLIGVPFFGDQHYNVHRIEKLEIGIKQRYIDLNKKDLFNSILTVMNDEKYKENIVRVSNLYEDQMIPPLEKAVWWIEHTIRTNGSEYLRSDNIRQAPLFRFYLFSNIIFTFCMLLLIVFVFRYLFYTKSYKLKSE